MSKVHRVAILLWLAAAAAGRIDAQPFDPSSYSGMRWRMAGPFRGGRVLAVALVPGQPNHFYFGAVGGGVWETHNAGRTWESIFDGQPVASIGAIAVAPSDFRVVYVGTGEADMRSDISYGNGMYRSADGGKTWSRIGLEATRQIARIVVDPRDANRVYVAALGHSYGPNSERGVFRSLDGGHTWARVLFRDDHTGAVDIALDPSNPKTMIAALWQTRRPPWNTYPPSNGPGSGLFRSTDGGDSWTPVAGGFPAEKLGRVGLVYATSDPRRVYAIVDAKEGGLWASEDGGATWKRASGDRRIWERGWYFGEVTVDPRNADVIYVCNTAMYRSEDGGRIFLPVKGAPGGDDYHGLRIDPSESRRMILASDQGAVITVDGGRTWSSWYNQPTAQFYHVTTDDRFPYWIYGAQQDSGAAAAPSRTDYSAITQRDWRPVAVGGENGYVATDPDRPNIVYGGGVGRFDWNTLQELNVDPTLAYPGEYRGEWTLPLTISPRPPHALYFGNQFVFRTNDAGRHWDRISPDLTRENPAVPTTLDPATVAASAVPGPRRSVVYAIAASPLADGLLWCGTDDGLVWRTKDDGQHWDNVTPAGLTAWSKIGILEASHFDADTAYAAVDRHRLDDLAPYVYRTRDGGKTWAQVSRGIPPGSFVNAVREDPERRGLLYAGTETGVFVSFDDGDHWQSLALNLPNCSVRDLAIRRGDLVIATHGRSFWVLDDLSPLRQLDGRAASSPFLFAPRTAVRLHPAAFQGTPEPKDEPSAENPPRGAVIDYLLPAAASDRVVIEILTEKGDLVRRYASDDKIESPDSQRIQVTEDWVHAPAPPPSSAGMHRFVWDLHYAPRPELARGRRGARTGVWAPPGRYTVRLTAAGTTRTQPLVVVKDPRVPVSDEALVRQYELAHRVEDERVRLAVAYGQALTLREQAASVSGKASGDTSAALAEFRNAMEPVAGPPISLEEFYGSNEPVAPTTLLRLTLTMARFQDAIESADADPSPDAAVGFTERQDLVEQGLSAWQAFVEAEVPKANRALEAASLPPLKVGG